MVDGIKATVRGVNSGQGPDSLTRDYVSFAINASFRGGSGAHQRPGIKKLELDWGGNELVQDGLFQGASYFKPRGGPACLVAAISGRLIKFDVSLAGNPVSDISVRTVISGLPVYSYSIPQIRQVWFLQAEDWLIQQNGIERPIFYDGTSARRSRPGEMLPGLMMEYHMGRVWVVRPDRLSFVAGDIVYSDAGVGTAQFDYRDSILGFTENDFFNEGGEFTVPLTAGLINTIKNVAVLDTSTGQGPLQVGTDKAIFSVNAPPDRTTWKDLTWPIGTTGLINSGPLSQDGTVNVNGDLWYRAKDGYRSYIVARRQFGEPGNTPMSREMNRVIEADDKRLLGFDSAIVFDNRLIRTCSPATSFAHGTYHRGLVALDFDIVSSMSNRLPPAYDGLWTGVRVLKLLVGDFDGIDRAFAFVLSSEDKIELWEITTSDIFDNTSRRIEWVVEGPALFDGVNLHKLMGGEVFIDQLSGRADFDVKWRPDQYQGWFDWHSWSECATYQTCTLENCAVPGNWQPQYRSRMTLPENPAGTCVTEDNRPSNFGYTFQQRVAVTGAARMKALMVKADVQPEEPFLCRGEGACKDSNVCQLPVFSYSAEV